MLGTSIAELVAQIMSSGSTDGTLELLRSLLEPKGELEIATQWVAKDVTAVCWSNPPNEESVCDQERPEDLGDNWWLCPACSDAFESTELPSKCELCEEPYAAPIGRVVELDFGARGTLWLSEAGDYAHAEGHAHTWTSYNAALARHALDCALLISHSSLHQATVLGEDGEGQLFYQQGNVLWSLQRGKSEPTQEHGVPKVEIARRLLQCLVDNSEWKQFTALAAEHQDTEAKQERLRKEESLARQNRVIADWRSNLIDNENLAEAFAAHFEYLAEETTEKVWLAEIAKRVESVRLAPKRPELHFAFHINDEPCTLAATLPSALSTEHIAGLEQVVSRHNRLELLLDDGTPIFSTAGLDEQGALEQHPCFIDDPKDKVALMLFNYESFVMLDSDGVLLVSEESCLSPLLPLRYPGLCLRFLAVAVLGGHYKTYLVRDS